MKRIDPFTVNLPVLDLHGETTDTAKYLIDSFIKDNYTMGKYKLVIIHGKSSNILKNKTKEILNNNIYISNFYIDFNNDGQTIVELKKQV